MQHYVIGHFIFVVEQLKPRTGNIEQVLNPFIFFSPDLRFSVFFLGYDWTSPLEK